MVADLRALGRGRRRDPLESTLGYARNKTRAGPNSHETRQFGPIFEPKALIFGEPFTSEIQMAY